MEQSATNLLRSRCKPHPASPRNDRSLSVTRSNTWFSRSLGSLCWSRRDTMTKRGFIGTVAICVVKNSTVFIRRVFVISVDLCFVSDAHRASWCWGRIISRNACVCCVNTCINLWIWRIVRNIVEIVFVALNK